MRTTRRYLAQEIYRSSSVVLIALLGLFTLFALIEGYVKFDRGGRRVSVVDSRN